MQILECTIEGYRSIKEAPWTLGQLNLITGTTGAGKSNLINALMMLSKASDGKLSAFVRESDGIDALRWDGEAKRIRITIKTDTRYTYKLSLIPYGISGHYIIEEESLKCEDTLLVRSDDKAEVFGENNQSMVFGVLELQQQESLLSSVNGALANSAFAESRIGDFRTSLAQWQLYKPLRLDIDSATRRPIVSRYETKLDAGGQNFINVLHTLYTGERQFKRILDRSMRAVFGNEFEELVFAPTLDKRIKMMVRFASLERECPVDALSSGTLQFLFLLTALNLPEFPPVMFFDEIERSMSSEMFPVIASQLIRASSFSQISVATNNSELIEMINKHTPQQTKVRWRRGQTTLSSEEEEVSKSE